MLSAGSQQVLGAGARRGGEGRGTEESERLRSGFTKRLRQKQRGKDPQRNKDRQRLAAGRGGGGEINTQRKIEHGLFKKMF